MNTRSMEVSAFSTPFSVQFEYEHHTDEYAPGYEVILTSIQLSDSDYNVLDLLSLEATGEIVAQIRNKLASEDRGEYI